MITSEYNISDTITTTATIEGSITSSVTIDSTITSVATISELITTVSTILDTITSCAIMPRTGGNDVACPIIFCVDGGNASTTSYPAVNGLLNGGSA